MITVTTHRGIAIYEDYGYYTSSLDPTVESHKMEDIVEFINDMLGLSKERIFKIDVYIVTECLNSLKSWNN